MTTEWDVVDGEVSKWDVVAALKKSGLPTSDRIIMMMLVDAADADTAIVPEQWTPSLTELAEWTGLGRSTVATRLKALERLGWVKRARPATADAIVRGARTCYHLAIGQAVEKVKPARTGGGRHGKPASSAVEPVQPLDQATAAGSDTGLVQPLNRTGSAVEPPLVQPLNRTGSAVEHKSPPTHQDPTDPPRASADAAAAAPALPGLEGTEQAPPPKPKRKRATKAQAATGEPTEGQRVNVLAKRYTDVVKLVNFQGVRVAVLAAVRSGDYTDAQIGEALDRLALPENRSRFSVSANTLRIELESRGRRTAPARTTAYQDPPDTSGYRKDF